LSESELFREVEEEVRKERYKALAKRFGPYFVGLVLVVVLVVGGWFGWQAWQSSRADEDARAYVAAVGMLREGRSLEAADALAELAVEASGGYRALALLQRAGALEDEGMEAAAAESYRRLANDAGAPPPLRAVAGLRAGLAALRAGEDLAAVRRDLAPLLRQGNPYRPLAVEVEALALLQGGDRAGAVEAYRGLAADPEAGAGVRRRAEETLRALGQTD